MSTQYRDACGVLCQDLDLPNHLDEHAAAWLVIAPGRCVVLHAGPWSSWTLAGVQVLAWRVAGRVPVICDDIPPGMADDLDRAVLVVLDWAGAVA
jgi:hypothetical protein